MDCRGLEGKLAVVGAHTGPGLGVSTNKAPLAHLPAHWHTEHGNRNQFTPASLEQETLRSQTLMHLHTHFTQLRLLHTHSPWAAHIQSQYSCTWPTNTRIPTVFPWLCNLCWASWLVSVLWIFYNKFYNKWVNLILGLSERQTICLHRIMRETLVHHEPTDKCNAVMQLCSFLPSLICYQLSLIRISVGFYKYMYLQW